MDEFGEMDKSPVETATENALKVNFDSIPEALQTKSQFVVWKYELDGEDLKKPPFSPKTGKRASVRNSATWGSMEDARNTYETGNYAGVGYVLTGGIVGIDIDHCIIDGELEAEAAKIIAYLRTYAEASPSGTGVRILMFGSLPGAFRRAGNIEMYQDMRYLTLTGHWIASTPLKLTLDALRLNWIYRKVFESAINSSPKRQPHEARQPARRFVSLPDQTVLDKALNAKNGRDFARYYYGDNSLWEGSGALFDSQSEADLALVYRLLYWTNGDVMQTERLFRLSGLMRPKWDRVIKDNKTYGEITIDKALPAYLARHGR
jgi:putative DNA primase/helicase